MKTKLRRVAADLLSLVAAHAPTNLKEWVRAMQAELDHVEGDWSAFFWALGGIAAVLKLSMLQLLLTPRWKEKNMIKYIGQILLSAIVALAVCFVWIFVWLTALKVAGLQWGSLPMWRWMFIFLVEVIYVAIATKLWRRRKLVSVGIALAGFTQLLFAILTAMSQYGLVR